MSLELFNAVPAGAIETVVDGNNKPHFMRAGLGRFLGIVDVGSNYSNIATKSRSNLTREGQCSTRPLGRSKNPHDALGKL